MFISSALRGIISIEPLIWQRLPPSGFTLYTLPLDFTKVGNVSGYYVGRLVVVVVGRVNQHSSWYLHLLE
jgi:hypothetical protein